ncbi:Smr/MutS family protein [Pelotalea chapellei]|uniref:Smr/MutS family protein n=1 Tax=Pelotalea chapellei TaxID=44671 RepID=A0ABS5U969_9BACT|nr:Smr/MutS family protein [Pelotalea chapellei]MBT1072227.1 Smr/MutS family protein [Pelotalea chapellei]
MAKKKKQEHQPKPAIFKTTPFSALKGVAVSVPEQPEEPKAVAPQPKPAAPDEAALFLQAMEGVTRVDGRQPLAKKAPAEAEPAMEHKPVHGSSKPLPQIDPDERAAFAEAIGQLKLDVAFTDQIPEDEEIKALGANRLRQLKRGVIIVDRQLDLHGLTREEALEALPRFLGSAAAHGEKAVLIITGKGNNSPAEPVLQQAVAGWLRDAGRKLIVEYAPAPRDMGGSGAFVVFLRG